MSPGSITLATLRVALDVDVRVAFTRDGVRLAERARGERGWRDTGRAVLIPLSGIDAVLHALTRAVRITQGAGAVARPVRTSEPMRGVR